MLKDNKKITATLVMEIDVFIDSQTDWEDISGDLCVISSYGRIVNSKLIHAAITKTKKLNKQYAHDP